MPPPPSLQLHRVALLRQTVYITPHSIITPPPGSPRENPNLPPPAPLIQSGSISDLICRRNLPEWWDMSRNMTRNRLISVYCYFCCVFQAFGDPATPRRLFFLEKTRPNCLEHVKSDYCPFWSILRSSTKHPPR